MNKRKLGLAGVVILFFSAFLVIYFNSTKQLFGNDKESIARVINSIEGYENSSIEILKIKDFDDSRVVAFLSNNSPGYIQFYKNKDGNYKWQRIEVRDNEAFSTFNTDMPAFMFVTNSENIIAKMQVTISGNLLEQTFTPYKAEVAWLDFPQTDKSEYTFDDYRYYDKDGNLIEDYYK